MTAVHPAPRGEVPLAPFTTLELGGPARFFLTAEDSGQLLDALRWAAGQDLPVALLGGGSNVVVADEGYPGLVVRIATRGVRVQREGEEVLVTVAAGEIWDDVVALAVAEGWAGIECLSGIPGTAGATPVQNVGAYGQEVGQVLRRVELVDRRSCTVIYLHGIDLEFGYRTSRLRRQPHRWAVLRLTVALRPGGSASVRHGELATALAAHGRDPGLARVRETVLQLRRGKSMLVVPDDPNRRSVGSFFLNPTVPPAVAADVARRAAAAGLIHQPDEMPRFPGPNGLVKLSAAWLVERAGFPRGFRRGAVGVSSRHALALVHHGDGRSAELLALASDIVRAVRARFGIHLQPEPTSLDGSPLLV